MNVFSRGIRNAFRNGIRTFSIVLILGLSVGLALAMLVARQAVNNKIATVKSTIGNTITVTPAGAQGFAGGGDPLTNDQVKQIQALAHVSAVTATLSDRLTTSNTNLQSAVDAGSIGRRAADNSGVSFQGPPPTETRTESGSTSSGSAQVTRTFTPPVILTGVNDANASGILGGTSVTFTSGSNLDASKDENVAIVGKALAEKNNLSVGSTFQAYGTAVKVVGIYDTGNTFSNNSVIMPLIAVQRLSTQPTSVTNVTVTADSIDNVDGVVASLKTTLGDKADITSNQEAAKEAVAPLESVKTVAAFSLIGALVAGSIIILLTMVMIVRERRREIGVIKAIGGSNLSTVVQFMSEAVTLTVMGLIVGLIVGFFAATPVTKMLVNNSTSSSQTQMQGPPGAGGAQVTTTQGGQARGGAQRIRAFGGTSATNIRNVKATVGLSTVFYGALAAVFIAIVGSALPALMISKVRPAEVMRAD